MNKRTFISIGIFAGSLAFVFGFAVPAQAATAVGLAAPADQPTVIYVPSIGLLSHIQGVGVNNKGEMDVPSGKTNKIGWYQYGVAPGDTGTAVLDAHVFAGFKNLANLAPGADIYILMQSGKQLHFVATQAKTYPITTLSSATLFAPSATKQLNLITCAGNLTADHSTYDHRLIVSAQLV